MTTTVVVGGSFAGMTAAIEIKRKGKDNHKVILIDKSFTGASVPLVPFYLSMALSICSYPLPCYHEP